MFYALSALAYLGGALWVTRPLLWHFSEAIPVGTTPRAPLALEYLTADSHQLLFYAWLFVRNVREHVFAFANTIELAPFNASGMHPMGSWSFPMQPLWWGLTSSGLSSAAAYNVLVLASYPVTGLSMVFCLRRLGASRVAAFVGGVVYAFCVFRQVQLLGGHANGFLVWLVPWMMLAVAEWRLKPSYACGLLLGAALFMMALGEWHLFYYSALFVAVLVLMWLAQHRRDGLGAMLRQLATLVPPAVLAIVGFAWVRYTQSFGMDQSAVAAGRTAHEAVRFTLLPFDLFVPWVRFTRAVIFSHDVERRSSYLGLSVLAIVVLAWRSPERTTGLDSHTRLFAWTALIALLLAFSPVLAPLYALLKLVIPYWGLVRVKGRLLFLVMFGLAGLAAWAVDRLGKWQRWLVAAAVADFVVVAPCAMLSRGPAEDSPVVAQATRGDGPLLVLPFAPPDDAASSVALRIAMLTNRPMVNGYEPVAPQSAYEAASLGLGCELARRYNIHTVVQDLDAMYGKTFTHQAKLRRDDLRVIGQDQHYILYETVCPDPHNL